MRKSKVLNVVLSVLPYILLIALSTATLWGVSERNRVIEAQQHQIEQLRDEIHHSQRVISDMEKERAELQKDVQELQGQINLLVKERDELRKQVTELKRQQAVTTAVHKLTSRSSRGRVLTVEASAYTAYCKGCSGKTATGIDIRYSTPKIIAVDPNVIPLGSKVELIVDEKSWGIYTAADTGGAIRGHKIDVLMRSKKEAKQFGRRDVQVRIL